MECIIGTNCSIDYTQFITVIGLDSITMHVSWLSMAKSLSQLLTTVAVFGSVYAVPMPRLSISEIQDFPNSLNLLLKTVVIIGNVKASA
jgi:hypothetical protein